MNKELRGCNRKRVDSSMKNKKFAKAASIPRQRLELEEIRETIGVYDKFDAKTVEHFTDFPLSSNTQDGLQKSEYIEPTEIQKESIGFALRGFDILGAAKTGSGKTLAFLIPLLECLWRNRWSTADGLGALVISPTRELALQTFEVLRKIGREHGFSAALIIGGTDLRYEQGRICRTNIVIGTPGRLLQHMDETPQFTADSLQMLVLDEADRILDMGFSNQLKAIIENLPTERQTLLFSATQTKSVKDLARISVKDPVYVSVHEYSTHTTPDRLNQNYVICEEHEKLSFLWSFLRSHLHSKILVFLSSWKQVRFVDAAFRRLRPGQTLLMLHGSMNARKRVARFEDFNRKQHATLIATDVAARGLDFPNVDWVVQLDCPPDINEYIHRSGRTARFNKDGEALLVLTPSQEAGMVAEFTKRRIPIGRIEANPRKLMRIGKRLETLCAQDPSMKTFAQRAFLAYLRSVFLMGNKEIFRTDVIDLNLLAQSYGLLITPRVPFLHDRVSRKLKSKLKKFDEHQETEVGMPKNQATCRPTASLDDDEESESRMGSSGLSAPMDWSCGLDSASEDEDSGTEGFMNLKRKHLIDEDEVINESEPICQPSCSHATAGSGGRAKPRSSRRVETKISLAKKVLKKGIPVNQKIVFGDENIGESSSKEGSEEREIDQAVSTSVNDKESGSNEEYAFSLETAKARIRLADKKDKAKYRDRIKRIHKEKRLRKKLKANLKKGVEVKDSDEGNEPVVTLGSPTTGEAEDVDGEDIGDSVELPVSGSELESDGDGYDAIPDIVQEDEFVHSSKRSRLGDYEKLAINLLGSQQ